MDVDSVAQSVEQQPFKLMVVGSIPTRVTTKRSRETSFLFGVVYLFYYYLADRMKKAYILTLASIALLGAGCIKHPYETGQGIPRQDFPFVSTTPTVSTTDWKTFTNDAAGITFKYPSTWPTPVYNEVSIDLGPMAGIDLISPDWFKKNYEGCIKKQEEDYCKKDFGRTPIELDQMIAYVSGKNMNAANYNVGCDAINSVVSKTGNRAVYFCGYDASIDNYVYYAPAVINGTLVELRLPLFPRDTPVYAWASEASGGDMATNYEIFTKNLETSLKNGQPNEVLAKQLAEYNAIADSVKEL